MGFPACPWCQAVVPHVNKIAKEEGFKTIYYLDILDMRNETSKDHNKYLELKNLISDAVDKEKDRINGPTFIVVKNGQMVGYHLDTVSSHQLVDGILPPMTNDQINELHEILRNLIKKGN
jgi:thiol-disulfide isomerase/thioredoxin